MNQTEVENQQIVIDPNTTFKVVLECHKGMDPEPYFLCRHLSARKYKELSREYDSLDLSMKDEDALELTNRLATTNMIGWENQVNLDTGESIKFDASKIDMVCGAKELWEIITKVLRSQRIGIESKKNSDSQSDSNMVESVKIAEVPEDAKQSPQNTT